MQNPPTLWLQNWRARPKWAFSSLCQIRCLYQDRLLFWTTQISWINNARQAPTCLLLPSWQSNPTLAGHPTLLDKAQNPCSCSRPAMPPSTPSFWQSPLLPGRFQAEVKSHTSLLASFPISPSFLLPRMSSFFLFQLKTPSSSFSFSSSSSSSSQAHHLYSMPLSEGILQ